MQPAVDLQHVLGAGRTVEAIDILGEGPNARQPCFHRRDDFMRAIERCPAGRPFDLAEILPGQLGAAANHLAGEDFFDGNPFLGMLDVVQPADAAIGGQARIGGDSRPGNEEQAAGLRQMLHYRVDCAVDFFGTHAVRIWRRITSALAVGRIVNPSLNSGRINNPSYGMPPSYFAPNPK